jgi:hypothetical protein
MINENTVCIWFHHARGIVKQSQDPRDSRKTQV